MQEKNKDNKNIRNKSTNIPSNQPNKPQPPTSNTAIMNKSGNGIRKSDNLGLGVKLPKVSSIASSNVSNTSMKTILDGSIKKNPNEAVLGSGSR